MTFVRRGNELLRLPTSSSGAFSAALAPGRWTIFGAYEDGGMHLETAEVAVVVVDGRTTKVELPFANDTTVRVTVDGAPLITDMTLEPRSVAFDTRARLLPKPAGRWRVVGLHAGAYVGRFELAQWKVEFDLDVPSSREVDLTLHPADIQVRDRDGESIDAEVRVVGGRGDRLRYSTDEPLRADSRLPAGTYDLAVHARGYKDATATIVVPSAPIPITLETRDRPFPRPADLTLLADEEAAVIAAVLRDLGDVTVADQTVQWPAGLERHAPVGRLPPLAAARTIALSEVALRPPREWDSVAAESQLYIPGKAALLTTPVIEGDQAFVVVTRDNASQLYRLTRKGGRWEVVGKDYVEVDEGG
jgi:hypothetical protein